MLKGSSENKLAGWAAKTPSTRSRSRSGCEWMTTILPHLTIISHSASPPHPSITFRLTVRPIHCNGGGNLHGGCTSTIFDGCTTMLLHLVSKPGYWQFLGVSRTLNVTYLRPVPVGTTVDIRCEILQLGRRLCTLRGEMRAVDGREEGPVLAVCEHGKVNTDPPPAEKFTTPPKEQHRLSSAGPNANGASLASQSRLTSYLFPENSADDSSTALLLHEQGIAARETGVRRKVDEAMAQYHQTQAPGRR
ncbi:HotDog domain-containing protein [Xylariaceae sp. FL0662B]|nr:HotDog domain-containing protein [Xylariaceae sp. FL0662B]